MTDPEHAPIEIVRLDAEEAADAVTSLAELLVDSVDDGASVGFVWPFEADDAAAWWKAVFSDVRRGVVVLFAARAPERIVGTVQLRLAQYPNGRHRAEVAKLLVHTGARRQGIARALMAAVEEEARRLGRSLLVPDTATDAAERLYASLGYSTVGVVPGYAADPDGTLRATTIMWRRLVDARELPLP